MKLYQQLVLFMLAATVLPLAAVGFLLLSRAEAALSERVEAEQRALALSVADGAASEVMKTVDAVARSAELIDWRMASEEETRGGLALLYGQSPELSAVVKVDATGAPLGDAVFAAATGSGHPSFADTQVPSLARAVDVAPLRRGGKGQAALGPPYQHAGSGSTALALAVKLADGEDAPFAVAELVLRGVSEALRQRAEGSSNRLELVDGNGRVLASSRQGRGGRPEEGSTAPCNSTGCEWGLSVAPGLWAEWLEALGTSAGANVRASEPPLRGSVARVPHGLGLYALVTVDEAVALAPVHSMRRTVLVTAGAALCVLLVLGGLFTRRVNRRLGQVVAGAEAYARGELDQRVSLEGRDELTHLAATFNRMGSELESARGRLLRWNDDLKARVEEATADLKAAQAQLLEAQKLAAVGQLGAGVAHEINNPLAGILGNAQLLLLERSSEHPDFEALRKIEQSAKRCKEITQNLLRFSQPRASSPSQALDLNRLVKDVASRSASQLEREGITLHTDLHLQPLRVQGDAGQLAQTVLALVSNARTAMLGTATKRLTLRTGEAADRAVLEVVDTGKGILPEHLPRIFEPFFTTKDVWSNVGLGLSVAYRAVHEAHGSIEVTTAPGEGSTFTVRLPRAFE